VVFVIALALHAPCLLHCLALQVYLITELVTGGELLDAVLQRGTYSEQEARSCFIQLLRGIAYLHSK
jgi:serine/threonine protein kinase